MNQEIVDVILATGIEEYLSKLKFDFKVRDCDFVRRYGEEYWDVDPNPPYIDLELHISTSDKIESVIKKLSKVLGLDKHKYKMMDFGNDYYYITFIKLSKSKIIELYVLTKLAGTYIPKEEEDGITTWTLTL